VSSTSFKLHKHYSTALLPVNGVSEDRRVYYSQDKDGIYHLKVYSRESRENALLIPLIGPDRQKLPRRPKSKPRRRKRSSDKAHELKIPKFVLKMMIARPYENLEKDNWALISTGKAFGDCGEWRDDVDISENMLWEKRYKHKCKGRECPDCWVDYIKRQLVTIIDRFDAFERTLKIINRDRVDRGLGTLYYGPMQHVTFSADPEVGVDLMQTVEGMKSLRRRLRHRMKAHGLKGAVWIFHPFRFHSQKKHDAAIGSKRTCGGCKAGVSIGWWYESPHWHCIGYGFIHGTGARYRKDGWIIKNHGKVFSLPGLIWYLLSHTGYWVDNSKKMNSLGWFGDISQHNFKREEEQWVLTNAMAPDGTDMIKYKSQNGVSLIDESGNLTKSDAELRKFRDGPRTIKLVRHRWRLGQHKKGFVEPFRPKRPMQTIEMRENDLKARMEPRQSTKWWLFGCQKRVKDG